MSKRAEILSSKKFQDYEARLAAAVRSVRAGHYDGRAASYWAVNLRDLRAEIDRLNDPKPSEASEASNQPTLFDV